MSIAGDMDAFEIAAVCASLALFAGYHIYLYVIKPNCLGAKIPFAINMVNAEMWLKKHKEMNESATILLAIQTLRNTLMAAVFVGGNAINIAYDLANGYQDLRSMRLKVRSLVIMSLMFSSFLCWANVIRLASVLGYLIGTMQYSEKLRADALEAEKQKLQDTPIGSENPSEACESGIVDADSVSVPTDSTGMKARRKNKKNSAKKVVVSARTREFTADSIPDIYEEGSKIVKMVTIFFSFGFRLMFVSIPFAFFTAGPIALVITSAVLFVFLHFYDYVRHQGRDD